MDGANRSKHEEETPRRQGNTSLFAKELAGDRPDAIIPASSPVLPEDADFRPANSDLPPVPPSLPALPASNGHGAHPANEAATVRGSAESQNGGK